MGMNINAANRGTNVSRDNNINVRDYYFFYACVRPLLFLDEKFLNLSRFKAIIVNRVYSFLFKNLFSYTKYLPSFFHI